MEDFNKGVWSRLYNEGEDIVAEISPTLQNCRRWVAIYKAKPTHTLSDWRQHDYKYLIVDFELNKTLIDEYFSEEDKQNLMQYPVHTEIELLDMLQKLEIKPIQFTYPWKCDYPL